MPKRNAGPRLHWREENEVWEIVWYEQRAKRRKSTGTADRAEATRQLTAHLAASIGPSVVCGPQKPDERLIADVLADYLLEHGEHVIGKRALASAVKSLLPFWDGKTVRDVREGTCRAFIGYRAQQGVCEQTAGRGLSVLGAAIRHDWKAGRLTESVYCWRPAIADGKDRWLTRSEAARLLRAVRFSGRGDHLALFILIGLYTAARHETILSLRWSQIDLERGLIDLNAEGRERTSKGRPKLPISKRLMTFLRYAKRRGSDLGPVVSFRGKPIKTINNAFKRACMKAGLDDVTPHTLRHTSASWMVQAGVSFAIVSRYLGHASSATTERVYAHHAPDYLAPASQALDRPKMR